MDAIGQYRVERRLGSGAFATVWLGHDEALDANVAIKLLADNWVAQPDIVRRFTDEARLLWKSENPKVVDVFTFGTLPSGQPWFAMEYADRGTLADRLGTPIGGLRNEIALVQEMGRCVEAVHRLGAVHRDVKPSNFLIRSTTESSHLPIPGLAADERLLIGDLGLAKVVAEASGFTVAAGSPMYMAPEQMSTSAEITYATDVYALGVCAWEVLAGAAPASTAERQSLRTLRPDVPAEVEAVVLRAVATDPGDRWATVAEFSDALDQAMAAAHAGPAAAAPEAATQRSAVKQRVAVALAGLVAIVAVAAFAALLARDRGPDLGDAPPWFQLPAEVDAGRVTISQGTDGLSVVTPSVSDFAAECGNFLADANAAGYETVRDLCAAPDALASARTDDGATAVMAALSDAQIGWQFAENP